MEWVVWVYSVQARTQRHESIVRVTCVLLRVCIDRTSLSFWLIISCNQMTPYCELFTNYPSLPLCAQCGAWPLCRVLWFISINYLGDHKLIFR